MDSAGRIERFNKKYAGATARAATAKKKAAPAPAPAAETAQAPEKA
jgi:hypothetical protein